MSCDVKDVLKTLFGLDCENKNLDPYVPYVCVKKFKGCNLNKVTEVTYAVSQLLGCVKSEEDAVDFVYELAVNGSLSKSLMRKWLTEVLPRHGCGVPAAVSKSKECKKLHDFLTLTLPVLL